ncbi:hypothetical protein IKQ26_05225 [bacterium]|nr:hypothetical protein [bacterium]
MKRKEFKRVFIFLFSLLIFSGAQSFALTEVELKKEPLTLRSDLPRVEGTTIFVEKGLVDKVDILFSLSSYNEMTVESGKDFSDKFNFGSIAPGFVVHFKDKKTRAGLLFSVARNFENNDNDFWEKVAGLYLEHDLAPNNHISVGNRKRLPVTYEGMLTANQHPFLVRSQIARRFGNVESFGVRNTANYKYLDYDIGFYDGSRFMNKLFNGTEFIGMVQFKPLAYFNDKYGSLKIGGSVDTGNSEGSFNVFSANALYQYKKLYFDFEYAHANGYNRGLPVYSDKYDGFYTTLGYNITDKLQVLGRYDYLKNQSGGKESREYSAGLTYSVRPGLNLLANYVFVDSDYENNCQHKIYLGTRFDLGDFVNNL